MKTIDDKLRTEMMNLLRRQIPLLQSYGDHNASEQTRRMFVRLRRHFESQDARTPVREMVTAPAEIEETWETEVVVDDDGWESRVAKPKKRGR